MAAQVGVADVPTEEYAQAMEEAIDAATKAEAEANRLKRKYEPDEPEVLMDNILEICNDYGIFFMRVQVFTGEDMTLTLIQRARLPENGSGGVRFSPWSGDPGTEVYEEHFNKFGIYAVSVVYDSLETVSLHLGLHWVCSGF